MLLISSVTLFDTQSIAHNTSGSLGSLPGGKGETTAVTAFGFRIIPIKHNKMYVGSKRRKGDIDRGATYTASSGVNISST